MGREAFDRRARNASAGRLDQSSRASARRGPLVSGRIVQLSVGQGHGFIRLTDDRKIFFHRADLQEGTSINDFAVGDAVAFELLDDPVSGARAVYVRRSRRNS